VENKVKGILRPSSRGLEAHPALGQQGTDWALDDALPHPCLCNLLAVDVFLGLSL